VYAIIKPYIELIMFKAKIMPSNIDINPNNLDSLGNTSLDKNHIAGGEHTNNNSMLISFARLVATLRL
jgi:hypothetical protein